MQVKEAVRQWPNQSASERSDGVWPTDGKTWTTGDGDRDSVDDGETARGNDGGIPSAPPRRDNASPSFWQPTESPIAVVVAMQ